MFKFANFFILILCSLCSFSQEFSAYGIVLDENSSTIDYATVLLTLQEDSTTVFGTTTAQDGTFKIEGLNPGVYDLKITYLGFKEFIKELTIDSDLDIGPVILKETQETLDEVTVYANKPSLKKEADRLIFNVANTALTEGNILSVVKSAPGVLVLDNSISVKNQAPTVYINNRKVNLSQEEVIQLLESASASGIKSVEVITTPGAQYDAESGVVLNIVMDKNLVTGYRGRIFSNFTQGVFPRYNAGMSHFFKKDKVSLNVNYSYNKNKINRDNDTRIDFLNIDDSPKEFWRSDINRNTWSETHNISTNFDYSINENNTLSVASSMLLMPYFKYLIKNTTSIFDEAKVFQGNFDTQTLSYDHKYNLGFDVDYISTFKNESSLRLNGHYTNYDYDRDQSVTGNQLNVLDFNVDTLIDTNIFTAQADYSTPLNDASNLAFGVKGSFVETDSGVFQNTIINNQEVIDPNNTNTFLYNEDVLAAYTSYSAEFEKISLSAGLRVEQTNVKGRSIDQTITQDYFEWFPTVSLSYQASDKLNTYTNFKRSVERPSYQLINPFRVFLNNNIIVEGNPNLQPAFTNHWVLGVSINDTHTFETYLKKTEGSFGEIPFQNNTDNTLVYTSTNYGNNTELGFDYVTYFTMLKDVSFYFVTSFYYMRDEATINNQSIELDQWSNYSEISLDKSFLKDRSLNASFSVTYVGKNLISLQISESLLFSEFSLRKTLFNKKGVLSLVVSDLFNMQNPKFTSKYLNQKNSSFTDSDDRYIKLGFSYKFGNTTLSTNEQGISKEERERLEKQ